MTHFGENYIQEALKKRAVLDDILNLKNRTLHWHFIGRLQKNKIKSIVGSFSMIHSIASEEHLYAVSVCAEKKQVFQKVLLQVKIAKEDFKQGFDPQQIYEKWKEWQNLPHLQICGLMTFPPATQDPENSRLYFVQLQNLLKELQTLSPGLSFLKELSMGTSGDFSVAIEEGATFVRVGSAFFGERQ